MDSVFFLNELIAPDLIELCHRASEMEWVYRDLAGLPPGEIQYIVTASLYPGNETERPSAGAIFSEGCYNVRNLIADKRLGIIV